MTELVPTGEMPYVLCHCDADGYAAAAAVKHAYPNADVRPTNYGYRFPYENYPKGSTLVIVDFSFPIQIMQELDKEYNLIWIDHHSKSIDRANEVGFSPKGLLDSDRAACILAWEVFNPNTPIPKTYKWIDDFDRWEFKLPETVHFHYGIDTIDIRPQEADLWSKLIADDPDTVDNLLRKGEVIHDFVKRRDRAVNLDTSFEFTLGYNGKKTEVMAANIRGVNSMFFDQHPNSSDKGALIIFGFIAKAGFYRFSIYQGVESEVDVGEIALTFKGGGHVGAGGWTQSILDIHPVPTGEPDSFEDHLAGVYSVAQASPLLRNYLFKNDQIMMRASVWPQDYCGYKAVFCNNPYTWPDIWYAAPVKNAQIGIAFVLTKNDRFRLVFSDLAATDMTKLAEKIGGEVMPNGTVWKYIDRAAWLAFIEDSCPPPRNSF